MVALPILFIGSIKLLNGLVKTADKVFVHGILLQHLGYIFDGKTIAHLFYAQS